MSESTQTHEDTRGIDPGTGKYTTPPDNQPSCYHVVDSADECPRLTKEPLERSESYLEWHDIANEPCDYCASE